MDVAYLGHLNTPVFIAALVSRRYAGQRCSPRRCTAACEARSPVWFGAHRTMCVRARAADSYGLSNLIYVVPCSIEFHKSPPPVNAGLWPFVATALNIFSTSPKIARGVLFVWETRT